MPKWSEPSSQTSAIKEQDTKESTPPDTTTTTTSRRKELRMKNKQNVLAKMQSKKTKSEDSASVGLVSETEKEKVGTVRPLADVEGVGLGEGEREAKRVKAMVQDDDDVEMCP
jgi:tRNA (guanine-N(7)-)-methyltransferase subunit TRM82